MPKLIIRSMVTAALLTGARIGVSAAPAPVTALRDGAIGITGISKTHVLLTLLDGEPVYRDPQFA